jgi:hypothetical protein
VLVLGAGVTFTRFPCLSDNLDGLLVASFNNRPGGNATGAGQLAVQLVPKQMEVLHQLVPAATTIAVLMNPNSLTATTQFNEAQAAASALGLQLRVVPASSDHDLDVAFETMVQQQIGALMVLGDIGFLSSRDDRIAALAAIVGTEWRAVCPLPVCAQKAAPPVVGFVGAASGDPFVRAFRQGLGEAGYGEDRNVAVEYWLEGEYDRIPALVADFVRRRVAVIATPGHRDAAVAAKAAHGDDPDRVWRP